MRDRRKSLGVPSNLIWVLGDFDKIFRIDDFVWCFLLLIYWQYIKIVCTDIAVNAICDIFISARPITDVVSATGEKLREQGR